MGFALNQFPLFNDFFKSHRFLLFFCDFQNIYFLFNLEPLNRLILLLNFLLLSLNIFLFDNNIFIEFEILFFLELNFLDQLLDSFLALFNRRFEKLDILGQLISFVINFLFFEVMWFVLFKTHFFRVIL